MSSTPSQAAHRLKSDRFEHKAGTTVYRLKNHDYGVANADTRRTGVQHVSVTLKADGEYPGFTVPEHDLERVPAIPACNGPACGATDGFSRSPECVADHEATTDGASEQAIEAEIQAKGLTAPRLKPSDLTDNIVHTEIVKHVSQSGQVLRWAVLTTRNGFAVTGRPSASVSSANDNAEIGEKVAIDNARAELWPLMGYALRDRLAS